MVCLIMTRRFSLSAVSVTSILILSNICHAYEDDDLLCRPGWSPELYYQQIWQQNNQQRISMIEYESAKANFAAEQKAREKARDLRRVRQEKAARKREELIAKRKAENAVKAAKMTATVKQVKTTSKPTP